MTNNLYIIKCHTNLHVGSGDSNYGIIDNLVQRDVLTKFPMINESSLKGSIKEFFVNEVKRELRSSTNDAKRDSRINHIFGNEDGKGNYKFYAAQLLLFPVRTSETPYLLATCPKVLQEFCEIATVMGFDKGKIKELNSFSNLPVANHAPLVFSSKNEGILIEYPDFKASFNSATPPNFLGSSEEIVLMSDQDFERVCGHNNLPVIARNHLENGKSTNLWYEEIVPRQSVFYCLIGETDNEAGIKTFFATTMQKPMQIGANASIGYGLVTFNKSEL